MPIGSVTVIKQVLLACLVGWLIVNRYFCGAALMNNQTIFVLPQMSTTEWKGVGFEIQTLL